MPKINQQARIEVAPDQVAAVLAYAAEHHMSPTDVIWRAVELLTRTEGRASNGVTASGGLPAARLPDVPGRDYSSFGSMKHLPDGVEYEKEMRDEW